MSMGLPVRGLKSTHQGTPLKILEFDLDTIESKREATEVSLASKEPLFLSTNRVIFNCPLLSRSPATSNSFPTSDLKLTPCFPFIIC